MLTVRLLGPLEVSVGGRPVAVTAGRLQALLAALAMAAGTTVSVDKLAEVLWDTFLAAAGAAAIAALALAMWLAALARWSRMASA